MPAWSKDWEAVFKLHATDNATLEGYVKKGKTLDLKLFSEYRRADVVMFDGTRNVTN